MHFPPVTALSRRGHATTDRRGSGRWVALPFRLIWADCSAALLVHRREARGGVHLAGVPLMLGDRGQGVDRKPVRLRKRLSIAPLHILTAAREWWFRARRADPPTRGWTRGAAIELRSGYRHGHSSAGGRVRSDVDRASEVLDREPVRCHVVHPSSSKQASQCQALYPGNRTNR